MTVTRIVSRAEKVWLLYAFVLIFSGLVFLVPATLAYFAQVDRVGVSQTAEHVPNIEDASRGPTYR